MSDWFTPSDETVQFRPVAPPETPAERTLQFWRLPPESPAEQTTELPLFSPVRHRPLHDWISAQAPTEPLWPAVDPDEQP